jgi:hypothetical protein
MTPRIRSGTSIRANDWARAGAVCSDTGPARWRTRRTPPQRRRHDVQARRIQGRIGRGEAGAGEHQDRTAIASEVAATTGTRHAGGEGADRADHDAGVETAAAEQSIGQSPGDQDARDGADADADAGKEQHGGAVPWPSEK